VLILKRRWNHKLKLRTNKKKRQVVASMSRKKMEIVMREVITCDEQKRDRCVMTRCYVQQGLLVDHWFPVQPLLGLPHLMGAVD
jgi:hypothetical protein